jgi:hypothetical protein
VSKIDANNLVASRRRVGHRSAEQNDVTKILWLTTNNSESELFVLSQ